MKNEKISIIIVTYNNEQYILKLIDSIKKYIRQPFEIIVVDNDSQDNTVSTLEKISNIKLLPQSENLGFSKGNNVGVKNSNGDILFFLNPDCMLLTPIDHLVDDLKSDNVGIAAPKLMYGNDEVQPSIRKFPTLFGAFKEYFLNIKQSYEPYFIKGDNPLEVETVVGGAMLIKKSDFNRIGGFDERYFLYFEDLELCRQIKKIGLKIIYDPKVIVRHQHGQSAKTNPKSGQLLIESSKIYHGAIKADLLYFLMRFSQLINEK